MPPTLPPYALAVPAFRFRALAALAGRAPLGGPREAVLACFVGARLAAALAPASPLREEDEGRAARAAGARAWLAASALPAPTRLPLARLVDATARPVSAEEGAAAPKRRSRKPSAGVPPLRRAAETPAAPRAEVAAAVAAALAAVVAAAEPWLDQPARQELLQLVRELDPARELPVAPAARGAPLTTVGA